MARPASAAPRLSRTFARQKRGDLIVEEIKRWIASRQIAVGERLPQEAELQQLFSASRGTVREALKSLEVQGLVRIRTGPDGGAMVTEAPFERTFQLIQNYLFFRDVDVASIYAMRRLLEPELVAGAVPHLDEDAIARLAATLDGCAPDAPEQAKARDEADLSFHDIIAAANPDPLLVFTCRLLNEMLRRMIRFSRSAPGDTDDLAHANMEFHRAILAAIRSRDAERARRLMLEHMQDAGERVGRLHAGFEARLVLDSDLNVRPAG